MRKPSPSQTKSDPVKLARFKRRLQAHGITQIAIAERASVSNMHVCNVLAGRDISAKVLLAAKALLAEALVTKRVMRQPEEAVAS